MSENLKLVRSIYANWDRGDFSSTDWACPDIEFEIVGGPDPGSWTGSDGMADGWRKWLAAWDGYETKGEEFRELRGERVLVLGRMIGRGKTSGVSVQTEFANVLSVREGKISRLCLYSNHDRTLADLGIEE